MYIQINAYGCRDTPGRASSTRRNSWGYSMNVKPLQDHYKDLPYALGVGLKS